MDNKTFCVAPWTHYSTSSLGHGRICCLNHDVTWDPTKRKEAFNDPRLIAIKQAMIAGNKVKGCSRCYSRELDGGESLRQIYNSSMMKYLDFEKINEPEYEVGVWYDLNISNKCNQKCRICGPQSSTAWFKDADQLFEKEAWFKENDWDKKFQKYIDLQGEIPIIIEYMKKAPAIQNLEFKGGEPLYIDGYKILMRRMIEENIINKVKLLTVITNGTAYDPETLSLLKHFPKINLILSIDATEKLHEYTRGTSISWDDCRRSWNNLYDNLINKSPDNKFSINNVIYIYNSFNHQKLRDWVDVEFGKKTFMSNQTLYHPEYLGVNIMPHKLKKRAASITTNTLVKNIFSNSPESVDHLKVNCPAGVEFDNYLQSLRHRFKIFTKRLDTLRDENLLEIVPELSTMLQ